jgi:hypothetical protein
MILNAMLHQGNWLAAAARSAEFFVFEIENCEVVTFGGTLLRFGADTHPSTARVEPRSFEHDLDASGKPLSVYLGVRRLQAGEGNVGESQRCGRGGPSPLSTRRIGDR